MPTVLITGGTGLVGTNLTRHLTAKGYSVIILTRKLDSPSKNPAIIYALWNLKEQKIEKSAIERSDYIIHLAGAGVMDKSWTKKYKEEIVNSRTASSKLLVKALKETENKVKAVVSASAIGWYGSSNTNSKRDEESKLKFKESDPPANDFLGNTCKLWEQSIEPVTGLGKRLIKLRFGIVLSKKGGALDEFKMPMRFCVAGILGKGRQVISWIHIDDLCRMIIFALENEQLAGSYNAVAPEPVTNKKLVLQLAQRLNKFHIPVHVPSFLLHLFLGSRSIEILKSASVSCDKIKSIGFSFLYPSIEAALDDLTAKS